ncbi:MAG: NAD-dependent epimerase/dehydratase family protein [Acidimicrobiales bacterium]
MTTVAVTGASGSVGRRVVRTLLDDPAIGAVRAVDLVAAAALDRRAEFHLLDVARADLGEVLTGCDSVVHLAEDRRRRSDPDVAVTVLDRVLTAAAAAGCGHAVLLSSALVYGAYPHNPVPLTEHHPRRPVPGLTYATTKVRLEELIERWGATTGAGFAVLRPTNTLSECGASYIAGALRAATSLRGDRDDPPVQFLHHDDLAAAAALVATESMTSVFNVAPDGWIGPDVFADLLAEAELRLPEPMDGLVAGAQLGAARLLRRRSLDRGLEDYVRHPWVVANDRLRAAGWTPRFTNEEAYVLGTPAPWWRTFTLRRRQELALGAVGAATVGVAASTGLLVRRVVRSR